MALVSASHEPKLEVFFLDSDTPDPAGSDEVEDRPRRPWRTYWPPLPGSALHDWLKVECPVALSWRFDPSQPFDRPWQKWTDDARKMGRACPSAVLPAESSPAETTTSAHATSPTTVGHVCLPPDDDFCRKQRDAASLLDDKILEWGLLSVKARSFNYLAPLELYAAEKPFHSRLPFLDGLRRTNIVSQAYNSVYVHDINGHENDFTLAESGFEFCSVPVPITEWDVRAVREIYLPLMEAWLKEFFNGSLVHIYTYNFRSLDKSRTPSEAWISPFRRAHCDVTSKSCKSRLKLHLPEAATAIERGRYRFIGIWRPLTGPHQDHPLAICDYRTVDDRDLVPADVVFPHYCDEGYEVKYNRNHRWFYKRGMSSNDVILFKHYDNNNEEASFCPHSAFEDRTVPEGTPMRASIEIRAIVVG